MKATNLKTVDTNPAAQLADEAALESAMEFALDFVEKLIQAGLDREKGVPPWLRG